jgi:hypothetical protein
MRLSDKIMTLLNEDLYSEDMFVLPRSVDTKSRRKSPNQSCCRSVHLIVRDEIRPVLTNLVAQSHDLP